MGKVEESPESLKRFWRGNCESSITMQVAARKNPYTILVSAFRGKIQRPEAWVGCYEVIIAELQRNGVEERLTRIHRAFAMRFAWQTDSLTNRFDKEEMVKNQILACI